MEIRKIFNLLVFLLVGLNLYSQDIIVTAKDDTISCKIREIGTVEIKYNLDDYPNDLLFSIPKDDIKKIVFVNGKEMLFTVDMFDPGNYQLNKTNAIEIGLFSPLTGNFTIAYERVSKPGRSMEYEIGLIGLGLSEYNASGIFLRIGTKFIRSPDYYLRGMRYSHLLKGSYLKPMFSVSSYERELQYYNFGRVERHLNTAFAVHLVVGKQWVIDNFINVDYYFGFGYGFETNSENETSVSGYHYGFVSGPSRVPYSFTGGIKIGYLFR